MRKFMCSLIIVFVILATVIPTVASVSVYPRLVSAGASVITGGVVRQAATIGLGEAAGAVGVSISAPAAAGMLAAYMMIAYHEEIIEWLDGAPVGNTSAGDRWTYDQVNDLLSYPSVARQALSYDLSLCDQSIPIEIEGIYMVYGEAEYLAQLYCDGKNAGYAPNKAVCVNGDGPFEIGPYNTVYNPYVDLVTHSAVGVVSKVIRKYHPEDASWEKLERHWWLVNQNPEITTQVPVTSVDIDRYINNQIANSLESETPVNAPIPPEPILEALQHIADLLNERLKVRSGPAVPSDPEYADLPEVTKAADKLWDKILTAPEVDDWVETVPVEDIVPVEPTTSILGSGKTEIINVPQIVDGIGNKLKPDLDAIKEEVTKKSDEEQLKLDDIKQTVANLPDEIKSALSEDQPAMPDVPLFDATVTAIEKESLTDLLDSIYGRFQSSALKAKLNVTLSAEGAASGSGAVSIGGVGKTLTYDLTPLEGAFSALGAVLLALVGIRETYKLFS